MFHVSWLSLVVKILWTTLSIFLSIYPSIYLIYLYIHLSIYLSRKEKMYEGWQLREELYIQHMDYLSWCKETDAIESWISSREPTVKVSSEVLR